MIQRFCHSTSQLICVVKRAKWQREFLGSFYSGVIRYRAGRKDKDFVRKLFLIGEPDRLRIKIDARDPVADELCLIIKQFAAIWRDMPGFHLAAQILVEHRTEKEVVLVVDEGDLARAREIECGKQTTKPATNN